MECLECDGKTVVLDSIAFAGAVYRRRKCKICGYTFWTEELEVEDPRVVNEAVNFKKATYRTRKKEKLKNEKSRI